MPHKTGVPIKDEHIKADISCLHTVCQTVQPFYACPVVYSVTTAVQIRSTGISTVCVLSVSQSASGRHRPDSAMMNISGSGNIRQGENWLFAFQAVNSPTFPGRVTLHNYH